MPAGRASVCSKSSDKSVHLYSLAKVFNGRKHKIEMYIKSQSVILDFKSAKKALHACMLKNAFSPLFSERCSPSTRYNKYGTAHCVR